MTDEERLTLAALRSIRAGEWFDARAGRLVDGRGFGGFAPLTAIMRRARRQLEAMGFRYGAGFMAVDMALHSLADAGEVEVCDANHGPRLYRARRMHADRGEEIAGALIFL